MSSKNFVQTRESTVKIGPKHQVTIPAEVFQNLKLKVGDFLKAEVKDHKIVLKPQKLISKDQEWFWTKEWQTKERGADEDIKTGRLSGPFTKTGDLINHLDKLKKES